MEREQEDYQEEENSPAYVSQHTVVPATWSYIAPSQGVTQSMAFLTAPPYHSVSQLSIDGNDENSCDRNMNSTLSNNNNNKGHRNSEGGKNSEVVTADEFGFDIHSIMTMEILERSKDKHINGLVETRNEEVLRRVAEMQRMVENSEKYLNEQGELVHEFEMKPNIKLPWKDSFVEIDSDDESISSSKVSSNEDTPAPGVLKHSDSLVLLAESINLDLNGITKGLNLIGTNNMDNKPSSDSIFDDNKTAENTPNVQRRIQGLSQLLNDLHVLSNDLSQSESDSESVCTPNSSPIHRHRSERNSNQKRFRSSFGLHSPDNTVLTLESKDSNLREYLRQLKEASSKEDSNGIDLAAKKLNELYGFEVDEDTYIYTDSDVIDLTAIPPPQTPDELDALSVIDAAPSGFDDTTKANYPDSTGDFEIFLAKVAVAPPTQRITPAKELTPEEIMSFIIPPPPGLDDEEVAKTTSNSTEVKNKSEAVDCSDLELPHGPPLGTDISSESLYINASRTYKVQEHDHINTKTACTTHVIDYATVERKGSFSCCGKSKKVDLGINENSDEEQQSHVPLLHRRFEYDELHSPPERPPKNAQLLSKANIKLQPQPSTLSSFRLNGDGALNYNILDPPKLPPRINNNKQAPSFAALPPRKPIIPSIPAKLNFRPSANTVKEQNNEFSSRFGSPLIKRHGHKVGSTNSFDHQIIENRGNDLSPLQASPAIRSNGHNRSYSDCLPVCLQNPLNENKTQLSLLCSPQMSRRIIKSGQVNNSGSTLASPLFHQGSFIEGVTFTPPGSPRNCQIVNIEALLAKTDIAMTGLLMRLDQIAGQCSQAQAAGGGVLIDEKLFQRARKELTDHALQLVTASKLLVMSMSNPTTSSLPEHLTSCLAALRRITELSQDMTKHTTAPLQTRNIVLKIHDVASSFREMAGVQTGPCGAGPLALQAECLANVLATLLRSLRVFSP